MAKLLVAIMAIGFWQPCIGADQCEEQPVDKASSLLQTQSLLHRELFAESVVQDEDLSPPRVTGTDIFVAATGGSDFLADGSTENPGTNKAKPLESVQACVDRLKTAPKDSTCKLLGGTYRLDNTVVISGFQNGDNKEITAADPETEPVTIDGTREIPGHLWKWVAPNKTGCPKGCFSAKLPASIQDPWQLFFGDEMFINARWPNAQWSDKSLFDAKKTWGFSSKTSTFNGPSKCAKEPNPGANKCLFAGEQWTFNQNTKKCEDDNKMECRNGKKGGMVPNTGPGECEMNDATPDHPETGSKSLGEEEFDATGASVVINVGHWVSYASKVKKHGTKSSKFTYDSRPGWNVLKFIGDHTIYYLENNIQLLDTAGEWFFDPQDSDRRVYVKTLKNENPKNWAEPITARVQDYAFNIDDASHLKLSNMRFFATTVFALATDKTKKVTDLTFDSLTFEYPSATKRMLGDVDFSSPTTIVNKPLAGPVRNTIENCIFRYTEASPTLELSNPGFTIKNNLFEYIDWSAVSTITAAQVAYSKACKTPARGCFSAGAATLDLPAGSVDAPLIFKQNTVRFHGASSGPTVFGKGENNHFILNHIHGKKDLQLDGALISIPAQSAHGVTISQNWVHDSLPPRAHSAKWGLRFDRGQSECSSDWGKNGEMSQNVVFNTNGMNAKGNSHRLVRNTVMWSGYDEADDSKSKAGARDINLYGSSGGIGTCECSDTDCKSRPKTCCVSGDDSTFENRLSEVSGNLMSQCAGSIGGGKWKVATDEVDKVYTDQDIASVSWNSAGMAEEELRDPANLDFRPVSGGVLSKLCIGSYTDVKKGKEYWIPGHQERVATMPIPPHGSTTVKKDAHLMFKPALGAVKHFVYASFSEADLDPSKTPHKSKKLGRVNGPNNVIQPKQFLMKQVDPPRDVFWRVDAKFRDGSVKAGEVWKFAVAPKAVQSLPSSCVSFSSNGPFPLGAGWSNFEMKVPANGGRPRLSEHISSAEVCIKASHAKDLGSLQFQFRIKGQWKLLSKKEGQGVTDAEGCFVDVAAGAFPNDLGPWKSKHDPQESILGVLEDQGIKLSEQMVQLKVFDHFKDAKDGNLDNWSLKLCYDPATEEKVPAGMKGMCQR